MSEEEEKVRGEVSDGVTERGSDGVTERGSDGAKEKERGERRVKPFRVRRTWKCCSEI